MTYPSDAEMMLFRYVCQDDESAARFLQTITDVAHVWDDVVDGDVPVSAEAIDWAFGALVLELPSNAFYASHRAVLEPLIVTAAVNWRVATTMERDPAAAKHVPYILRSSYIDVVTQTALLVGGPAWAVAMCRYVRELNQDETMDDYLANLATEARQRGEN